MSDLNAAITRLERAGVSNVRATENLYQAAWALSVTMWQTSAEPDAVDATNKLAEILEGRAERTQGHAERLRQSAALRRAEVEELRRETEGKS